MNGVRGVGGRARDIAVWTACIVLLVPLLLTFDRGFDVTDEGLYLISAMHPRDVTATASEYHWYLAGLWRIVGRDLLALRLFGALGLLSSTLLVWRGYRRTWSGVPVPGAETLSPRASLAFVLIAAALFYAPLAPTPSYNLLVTIAGYVSLGAVLMARSTEAASHRAIVWWCVLAGIAGGFAALVKAPAGLAMLVVSSIACAGSTAPAEHRWPRLGALGMGAVAVVVLHGTVITSPHDWWDRLREGIALLSTMDSSHSISDIVLQMVRRAAVLVWRPLLPVVLCALLPLVRTSWRRAREPETGAGESTPARATRWIEAFVIAITGLVTLRQAKGGGGGVTPYLAVLLGFSTLTRLVRWPSGPTVEGAAHDLSRATPVLLLLGVYALAPGLGSNNEFDVQALLSAVPVFLLILSAADLAGRRGVRSYTITVTLVLAVAGALLQMGTGRFLAPYRLATSLLRQTERPWDAGPLRHIRVDTATARFFRVADSSLTTCGFTAGTDLLPLVHVPGFVPVLGGRAPLTAWYAEGNSGARAYNERVLRAIPVERRRAAYLIWTPDAGPSLPRLGELGIDLDGAYHRCGSAVWPATGTRIEFWKPDLSRP